MAEHGAGDTPEEALSLLLETWRLHPHPEVAAAIDLVAAHVESPTIRQAKVAETAERFLAVAARPDPAALGALLDVFPCGKLKDAVAQVEALAAWPRDPRIARRVLDLLPAAPHRSRAGLPFWTAALQLVADIGDPASKPKVQERIETIDACFAEPMRRLVGDLLRALLTDLPAPPAALPSGVAETVSAARARWATSTDGPDRQALLAQVQADPDNLELRMVYADACLAEGDPIGELITIQLRREEGERLTKEQSQREKQLLKEHAPAALGPLVPVLLKSSIKFRRGLLDAATIKAKHDSHIRPLIGDGRWATVRSLSLNIPADYHNESAAEARVSVERVVLHPVMRSLTSLEGDLSPGLLTELLNGSTPRKLHTLEVHDVWPEWSTELRSLLPKAQALPELRVLKLRRHRDKEVAATRWLFDAPLMERLRRVELTALFGELPEWLELFTASDLEALCLSDYHDYDCVCVSGEKAGLRLAARFRWPGLSGDDWARLCTGLAALPSGMVATLEMRWGRTYPPSETQLAALENAAGTAGIAELKLPKAK